MTRRMTILSAAAMLAASMAVGAAASETDPFLAQLEGSYVELFPVMRADMRWKKQAFRLPYLPAAVLKM